MVLTNKQTDIQTNTTEGITSFTKEITMKPLYSEQPYIASNRKEDSVRPEQHVILHPFL